MAKLKPEMLCRQCKKPQAKDPEKSNQNWSVFPTGAKCECGSEFVLHIDGEPVR